MGTAVGELLCKKEISLDSLQGRIVGIDSYNIIYQFLSSIRSQDGTPLMDSEGNVTSHLTGLLYRTINLIEKGIKPVFVFDGKPHKLKVETLKERHKIRTEAIAKHEEALKAGKLEEARRLGSRALKLTDEMIADAKQLLKDMGLPVVQAPCEGEAQIARMVEIGSLYACVSQDFDALLFGTPILLRNIAVSGKRKAPGKNYYFDISPELIDLQENLKRLNISRKKLIWIGILIGTDFNEKFPKIGAKTALKLVQKHPRFKDIIKETKFQPEFDFKKIEEVFENPEFNKDYKIEFKPPSFEKVKDFLCKKHDFSEERVENALRKLEKKVMEKGSQKTLQKWFK